MRRCRRVPENQPSAAGDDNGNRQNSQNHEQTLHTAPCAHAEAIDYRQEHHDRDRGKFFRNHAVRERSRVLRERHRYSGGAARIDYQQADPAVKKAEQWMKRFAKVGVLAADLRHASGEFGVDESAEQGDDSSCDPRAQNQRGGVHQIRDDVWIDEDSGADDAAHHHHSGVEKAKLPGESGRGCGWRGRYFGFAVWGAIRHG